MQQRVLFLEQTQLFEHRVRIGLLRVDAVSEYRLEQRSAFPFFRAGASPLCAAVSRYGAYRSGLYRIGQLVFFPRVETDLVDLLLGLAALRRNLYYRSAGAKFSARNTQPREPRALRVAADLIHPRAEGVPAGLTGA